MPAMPKEKLIRYEVRISLAKTSKVRAYNPESAIAMARRKWATHYVPVQEEILSVGNVPVIGRCGGCSRLILEGDPYFVGEDARLCEKCGKECVAAERKARVPRAKRKGAGRHAG